MDCPPKNTARITLNCGATRSLSTKWPYVTSDCCTWTVLQQDGPNHLGLCAQVAPDKYGQEQNLWQRCLCSQVLAS